MPKGPQGQKRPADVIGAAVLVGKIATGEEEESDPPKTEERAKEGGKARAKALPQERRTEIAKEAAKSRWRKEKRPQE